MSKKSCFIAERLFYWHREPFTALQEAAALKGGKEEPSEVSGGKVSWARRDWREGGASDTSLASVRAVGPQEELCETRTGWSSWQN